MSNIRPVRVQADDLHSLKHACRWHLWELIKTPVSKKKKRLTFTSCKMPPASTETKTSTCGDEGWLGSIIQAPDVQEFFSCAASVWQTGERVSDQIDKSHTVCRGCGGDILVELCVLYPWSGSWGSVRRAEMCVWWPFIRSVSTVCVRAPEDVFIPCWSIQWSALTSSLPFSLNAALTSQRRQVADNQSDVSSDWRYVACALLDYE